MLFVRVEDAEVPAVLTENESHNISLRSKHEELGNNVS
jgi:hypothetical protein